MTNEEETNYLNRLNALYDDGNKRKKKNAYGKECRINGCTNKAVRRGLCDKHRKMKEMGVKSVNYDKAGAAAVAYLITQKFKKEIEERKRNEREEPRGA